MTLEECTGLLAELALTLGADVDETSFRSYHRALQDVPVSLFEAAVTRAAKSCRFLPRPAELRQFADEARIALLKAHPFQPCVECSEVGWREVEINGVKRMVRCRCWNAHQAQLQRLGVGKAPLTLPVGAEER